MNLPVFFAKEITPQHADFVLDEATSRHCMLVLRMQTGERLLLTDGRGHRLEAEITDPHRKHGRVRILHIDMLPPPQPRLGIGISFTKNNARTEWFLEKATEIGVQEIFPLLCSRTEKERFRMERLEHILVAAMLQSQQFYLPVLHEPVEFDELVDGSAYPQRFIAHCEGEEKHLLQNKLRPGVDTLILIGPEGDFTGEEIRRALGREFVPVSLGDHRLRTETAGVVACTLLNAAQ